ncbi:hypothetical protein F4819DRAFT_331860 [Hypoxylon fuscum]|nr:hypothetical protein F4819DRAFT_331860 [Hypoxylon fuscum]
MSDELTVTNTMAHLLAVVALDHDALLLNLLLRASLGGVSKLITVGTLGNAALDGLTCIPKTLKILLSRLRPSFGLSRTSWLVDPAVMDAELLVQVTLKVHVSVGREQRRVLESNQVDVDRLSTECLFQVGISDGGLSLEILLNTLLDILHVLRLGSLDDLRPGALSVHISDLGAINLACSLALSSHVSYLK